MIDLDTIFALSSGHGRAGIAVVRVSGPRTQALLSSLAGTVPPKRVAALMALRAPDGDLIDKAMVLFFAGPRSATGEDVAEFHLHGSPVVVERLFSVLSGFEGCRPALPGEFTRRAFANDKLDLVEVEGLADLLAANSESQRRLAMRQFSGEASSIYHSWHQELIGIIAILAAAIDFADEDGVAADALELARPRLLAFRVTLEKALAESGRAAVVRRGLRVVIAGAPNVGKSSLLNALAGRKAAIVSDIAGTTRDVVEAPLVLDGLPVSLADTAGLREDGADCIENEGMLRARAEMADADILVWVVVPESDTALPEREPDLVVVNKADLVAGNSIHLRNDSWLAVSAKTEAGLDDLRARLSALVQARTMLGEHAVMVRARHVQAVAESIRFLNDALSKSDTALEVMAEDVRNAASALATITGRVGVEEFLGRIFQEFCIGK